MGFVSNYDWPGLAERRMNFLRNDPTIGTALKTLRKTPWAREGGEPHRTSGYWAGGWRDARAISTRAETETPAATLLRGQRAVCESRSRQHRGSDSLWATTWHGDVRHVGVRLP